MTRLRGRHHPRCPRGKRLPPRKGPGWPSRPPLSLPGLTSPASRTGPVTRESRTDLKSISLIMTWELMAKRSPIPLDCRDCRLPPFVSACSLAWGSSPGCATCTAAWRGASPLGWGSELPGLGPSSLDHEYISYSSVVCALNLFDSIKGLYLTINQLYIK